MMLPTYEQNRQGDIQAEWNNEVLQLVENIKKAIGEGNANRAKGLSSALVSCMLAESKKATKPVGGQKKYHSFNHFVLSKQ
jgi:hypothetical protein